MCAGIRFPCELRRVLTTARDEGSGIGAGTADRLRKRTGVERVGKQAALFVPSGFVATMFRGPVVAFAGAESVRLMASPFADTFVT